MQRDVPELVAVPVRRFEYPHAETMRALARALADQREQSQKLPERIEVLLDVYACYGDVRSHYLDVRTRDWMIEIFQKYRKGMLSPLLRRLVMHFLEWSAGFNISMPHHMLDEALRLTMFPAEGPVWPVKVRSTLMQLHITDILPQPREHLYRTIWWHYLWLWRDAVTTRCGWEKKSALARFVALTRDLRRQGLLSPQQLALVDVLHPA